MSDESTFKVSPDVAARRADAAWKLQQKYALRKDERLEQVYARQHRMYATVASTPPETRVYGEISDGRHGQLRD